MCTARAQEAPFLWFPCDRHCRSLSLLPSLLCLRYHVEPSAVCVCKKRNCAKEGEDVLHHRLPQTKRRHEDEKTRNFITYSSQHETDVRAFVCKSEAYYWVKMSHRPISQCLIPLIVIVY